MDIEQQDKDRIYLQEKYREEVRRQLEMIEREPRSGIIKFLNSGFGLWLLSAVFISGAGTLLQQWQKQADEGKARFERELADSTINRQAIERLDIEISFRLSDALLQLSTIAERVNTMLKDRPLEKRTVEIASSAFAVLRNLTMAPTRERGALYPEHAGYSLPTLLVELRRRLPPDERSAVERSLAALSSISNSMEFGSGTSVPAQAAATLIRNVVLSRWKGTAFHYIDCSDEKPFC